MNQREWKNSGKLGIKLDYTYYNKSHKILKQYNFNLNLNGDNAKTIIHHLRDTEEQRKYNDEHYELWGHNLDGTFEYGKYVIFVTKEEHTAIHVDSEETKYKKSKNNARAMLGKHHSEESKKKISENNARFFLGKSLSDDHKRKLVENHANISGENHPMYGKHHSEESKKKISDSRKGNNYGYVGENHWLYGKTGEGTPHYGMKVSEEGRKHMSDAHKGHKDSEETRKKKSISAKNKQPVSDETRYNMSVAQKQCVGNRSLAFKEYKLSGGDLSWNEFQQAIKNGLIDMYIFLTDNE